MDGFQVRPRFQKKLSASPEEVLRRLREGLADSAGKVRGLIVDHHVTLKIPPDDDHFWSPQLQLEVEADGEHTLLRGLYGPKPSVWLMFLFFYAFLGFVGVVVVIIGLSERSLGLPGRILWAVPMVAFVLIMVYLSARSGQALGKDQMYTLRDFLRAHLSDVANETPDAASAPAET